MSDQLENRVDGIPERFSPNESVEQMLAAEHLARYWWASQLAPGRRVLDAGCGVGYGTEVLGTAQPASLSAVDIAEPVVETVRKRLGKAATVQVGDLRKLPYADKSFDLVVCFEVIEHVAEQEAVVDELTRVLADDGLLAISSPNPETYPPGNPHHVAELTGAELKELLEARLPAVTLWRQHQWLGSAVLTDSDAARSDLESFDCRFAKVVAFAPGEEIYSVALASRKPIDAQISSTTVATGKVDFDRWVKLWHEQDDLLRRQYEYFQTHNGDLAELSSLRTQLRESEARLQSAESEIAELRRRLPSLARRCVGAVRHRIGIVKHKVLSRMR